MDFIKGRTKEGICKGENERVKEVWNGFDEIPLASPFYKGRKKGGILKKGKIILLPFRNDEFCLWSVIMGHSRHQRSL